MPGKTSQSGSRKQDSARERLHPDSESSGKKVSIWPEWSEAAILAEKWDLGAHGGGAGKGREKKGAQVQVTHYEDPEKVLLPSSLVDPSIVVWKRPSDPITADAFDKMPPTIVSNPESSHLDLNASNTHLLHSQLMCWVIGQLNIVWQMRHLVGGYSDGPSEGDKETSLWSPWEHIQPHPKGSPTPVINPSGKYYVRLYWMGCWRKITVDDKLPFLEKQVTVTHDTETPESVTSAGAKVAQEPEVTLIPLYPRTSSPSELWPVLLFKAILKIVSLDNFGGDVNSDYGESSVMYMLTRWPHIAVRPDDSNCCDQTWGILEEHLPTWICDWDNSPIKQGNEKEGKKDKIGSIVMGKFSSCCPHYDINPIPQSLQQRSKTSEILLKKSKVLPSNYDLTSSPQVPILVTQIRDKELSPPPLVPPLPVLQTPYYLGLTHREPDPNNPAPPPTSPNMLPRFVELCASVQVQDTLPLLRYFSSKSDTCSARDSISVTGTPTSESMSKRTLKGSSTRKVIVFNDTESAKYESSKEDIPKRWMDYSDFCSTFDVLQIHQNPTHFKHRGTYFDLSKTLESVLVTPSTKKGGASNLASASKTLVQPPKENNFLLIDSEEPVELLLAFSSICNWKEGEKDTHLYTSLNFMPTPVSMPPTLTVNSPNSGNLSPDLQPPALGDRKKSSEHFLDGAKKGGGADDHQKLSEAAIKSDSSLATSEMERTKKKCMISGCLVVQTYSWRTIGFGEPVLTISTTGTKGTCLMLPPGRHVFKLYAEAPIAYHLEVFSNKQFTLADEDSMFAWLSQDCCRLVSFSSRIINHFLKSSKHFGNARDLEDNLREMAELYVEAGLTSSHVKILQACALHTWSVLASGKEKLTDKMQRAWKVFFLKMFDIMKEGFLPRGASHVQGEVSDFIHKLRLLSAVQKQTEVPETWKDRVPTSEEDGAARVITLAIRQQSQNYLKQCMVPGSESNKVTMELLEQSLPLLEPLKEKLGVMMLRGVMKLDPSVTERLRFADDLFSTVYSSVYAGPFPSIAANSWTVVLRKTLHISEEQFMAFHFNCPLQSSLLRVFDNDTMAEMPRAFHLTIPCIYRPNHRGYTLQAEAWLPGVLMPGEEGDEKKWRLRVMTSSREKQPVLEGWNTEDTKEVEETFHKEEVMDYCLPNREQVLFRYLLSPVADCGISIQATVSKQDALFKLEILDHEQVLTATEGRGTCTIPLHSLKHSNATEGLPEQGSASHKYIVQGRVLMNSWPVEETAWYQLAAIKSNEQLEENSASAHKPNSGKKSKSKKKPPSSQAPPTPSATPQQFDTSKPHWILRVVTKESEGQVKVDRDTEKEDRLKSMVQAWEAEQPGRTKKALESRRKFLEARAIQENDPVGKSGSATDVLASKQSDVPKPNTGPVKIWQMDLTPFYIQRDSNQPPKLLDEEERQLRLESRQRKFREYRISRQEMLLVRNQDREARNMAKAKQLEVAAEWQDDTNHRRNELNAIRESIREKHLAVEKVKAEKEAELLAASQDGGRESKSVKGKGAKKKK